MFSNAGAVHGVKLKVLCMIVWDHLFSFNMPLSSTQISVLILFYFFIMKSRCLAAQEADEDRHRFFIGSSCLREENEILLVEFNEELVDSVCSLHTYSHPKEMVCLGEQN